MTVYLIQSEQNGYCHVVFNNLPAAREWMRHYHASTDASRHPYTIIERGVYSHWSAIGVIE
jgi:hypothetical protein